jgi:ATP-dependent Clp protease ATP-binding subunit ClpC
MLKRIEFHPSAQLAWAIANAEACQAGSEAVEPIHFLLAVLEVIDEAFYQHAEAMGLSAEDLSSLPPLAREAKELLGLSDAEVTRLRRSLRNTLQQGKPHGHGQMLRRSPGLRDLFGRGGDLAAAAQASSLTMIHVLRALLVDPPANIRDVLPAKVVEKPALSWETRVNRFADRFQVSRLILALTDIEGSTSIKSRFGDRESVKIFRVHDDLIREQMGRYSGALEIKTIGDSFLLAFSTERDAVDFALGVQSRLRRHKYLSRIPIKVRIGIHGGELLSKMAGGSQLSDPVFGIAIDTTARISSLAVGNQILLDRSVYEKASEQLAVCPPAQVGEIEWQSHGQYALKGLAAPLEIFEVGEKGLAAFVKPQAKEKAAPVGAPANPTRVERRPTAAPPPTPFLNMFGRDLSRLAREGRLVPLVGRNQEMKSLARYLQRTTKRNVIVIGEAGVGKTALVEGLARRLASESAPDFLRGLHIVQLSVADLVAGAKHRGDLEERVQRIVEEATSDPNLVLFFDEIHLVMKAGGGEGSPLDVANILKPALARDDFRCIGATTTEEYERHIKGNAAFARRFQILRLGEPSEAEAVVVCREWARRIEQLQEVVIDDAAVEAAVSLSARLIRGYFLPDKAIDLLQNAVAYVKVSSLSSRATAPTKELPRVGRAQVEAALEEQYGVSVRKAEALDPSRVQSLLGAELVGQEVAIAAIVELLGAMGVKERGRAGPLGVLLFVGPTGVGKTFAAECLGQALFGGERGSLGRFNMNEFKERHELARLIGAPPGFVGHEQAGAIFRFVQAHPQGLILLDEMEKAHAEIQDYFLQVFDKGEAMDSRGQTADFRRQLFVMTCNAALGERSTLIGFSDGESERAEDSSRQISTNLQRVFRREFMARIDRVIEFRRLMTEDYRKLFDRRCRALRADVERQHGACLEVTDEVRERLCALADHQEEGARGFIRLFERLLVAPLMNHIRANPKQVALQVRWVADHPAFLSPTSA